MKISRECTDETFAIVRLFNFSPLFVKTNNGKEHRSCLHEQCSLFVKNSPAALFALLITIRLFVGRRTTVGVA